jgi:integrase
MDNKKVKKILPKLRTCNNDTSKRWFIEYKIENPESGKLSKSKYYGDINKFTTVEDRIKEGQRIIDVILKNGDISSKKGSRLVKPDFHIPGKKTLTDFLLEYLAYKKRSIRTHTYSSYKNKIEHFIRWLNASGLENIKPNQLNINHVQTYVQTLRVGNTTWNHYINALRTAFKYLQKMQTSKANPFELIDKMPKLTIPAAAFQKHQMVQFKEILTEEDPQLWIFCQMIYYTFIRPGELRFIKIRDIDLENQKIHVRGDISKNKKSQYVAIPAPLIGQLYRLNLEQYPEEHYLFSKKGFPGKSPLGYHNMRNRFRVYLKKLGYSKRYQLYSWKHSGAAACARAGMNAKDLQLQLRHHSLDQVDQYLRSLGVMDMDRIINIFPAI